MKPLSPSHALSNLVGRAAPHHTTPHRTAPHHTAPHRTAPHRHHTTPRHTTPHHTTPHHTCQYPRELLLQAPNAPPLLSFNGPQGWFAKIKIADASQLDGLMGEEAYTEFCANEEH